MPALEIAVLSYHGWEIDPEHLAADVEGLRARGWRELSLDELEHTLAGRRPGGGRYFHVTIDDGAEEDRECVAALSVHSCPATLFIPLDTMSERARAAHSAWASSADVALQDHSLQHARAFHYRHVVGFHSDERPFMTSPERLGLRLGDPVCTFGGELVRPRFVPHVLAVEACRAAARSIDATPGSAGWHRALAASLIESGLGFRRMGRLCVAGEYETSEAFGDRVRRTLEMGKARLTTFMGRAPTAFAYPWWQAGATADACLEGLGYRLIFSGRGLCRYRRTTSIPRLFVSNDTPRPLDPSWLAATERVLPFGGIRGAARRALFA